MKQETATSEGCLAQLHICDDTNKFWVLKVNKSEVKDKYSIADAFE